MESDDKVSQPPGDADKLHNVFVNILKCICINFVMYLSVVSNVFLKILTCISLNFEMKLC